MYSVCFALLFLAGRVLAEYKVVCYYGSWAYYRWGDGQFVIEDFEDPTLCTHLIYTFAGLDSLTYEIRVLDEGIALAENDGQDLYRRTVDLKLKNPSLKVLLAIGGWNEGSYSYSVMASDASKRSVFISSVVSLLETYNFDGLDFDWEYPANRGGASTDTENFVVLLSELREEFDKHGWLLTVAVGMGYNIVTTSYSIAEVAAYADFINMMTYDFFGSYDGFTNHHTRLFTDTTETGVESYYNLNDSIHLWLDGGAPAEKLVLGMAAFGRTYTVSETENGPIGAACSGPGDTGPYTQESGFIGYYEMCTNLQEGGWTIQTDAHVLAPWAYKEDQWIAYDSVDSIKLKSEWAKKLGLGGGMMWSIENDDFRDICGGGTYPVLNAINSIWRSDWEPATTAYPPTEVTTTTSTTITSTTSTTTTTTTAVPGTVPGTSCRVGAVMSNPEDCSTYYQCTATSIDQTAWMLRHCPNELLFNDDISACVFPDAVVCGMEETHTTTTTLAPGVGHDGTSVDHKTPTTSTTIPTTTTTTTTQSHDVTPGLSDSCTVGSLAPDPDDCTQYYQCTVIAGGAGTWTTRDCPNGLYFNDQTGICDYPQNVDCAHN